MKNEKKEVPLSFEEELKLAFETPVGQMILREHERREQQARIFTFTAYTLLLIYSIVLLKAIYTAVQQSNSIMLGISVCGFLASLWIMHKVT